MRTSALPFDVPDDLPYDALYVAEVAATHTYACEQFVLNQGGEPYACGSAARWRATATTKTDDGYSVTGYGTNTPPLPFKIGEHRNVCGTHRMVLTRRRWDIEELPEVT